MSVALKLKWNAGANEFSIGLKKSEGQEFAGFPEMFRGPVKGGPGVVQQVRPGTGCVAEIVCDLGEARRGLLFDEREKRVKAG